MYTGQTKSATLTYGQKSRDLENRVRGPSRSLKVVPFHKLDMVSY